MKRLPKLHEGEGDATACGVPEIGCPVDRDWQALEVAQPTRVRRCTVARQRTSRLTWVDFLRPVRHRQLARAELVAPTAAARILTGRALARSQSLECPKTDPRLDLVDQGGDPACPWCSASFIA